MQKPSCAHCSTGLFYNESVLRAFCCLFISSEPQAFKAASGGFIPVVGLSNCKVFIAKGCSTLNESRYNPPADSLAPVSGVSNDYGHIFLPEGHISDWLVCTVFLHLNKVKLSGIVQIFIHSFEPIHSIGVFYAVYQIYCFCILVPLQRKIIYAIEFAQPQKCID